MPSAPIHAYTVIGMTCEHCVRSVVEEIADLPGVTGVDVDLATGRAEVAGEGVRDDAVVEAVAQAGFQVA